MKTNLFLTFCACILLSNFAQAQLPASQDFESMPTDNWNYTPNPVAYNISSDVWDVVTTVGGTVNGPSSGANFIGMRDLDNPNGGGSFRHTLTFDPINIAGQSNVQISFDYNADGYDSTDSLMYEVFYDGVGQGLVILANNQGGANTGGWQTEVHNISGTPTNAHLVVSAYQNGGTDYAGIDNFSIMSTGGPACQDPTSLAANNLTTTTADLSWTAGNVSPDTTVISIGATGFTAGAGLIDDMFSGSSYMATGLTASTAYEYYVREVCAPGDTSAWVGPFAFSTSAPPSMFPASQDFESMPSDDWNYTLNPVAYNVNGDIWDVVTTVGGTVTGPSSGANFLGMLDLNNANGGGAFRHTLTFEAVDITGQSNVEISFDYNADGYETTDSLMYEVFYDGVGQGLVVLANNQQGGNTSGWQTEVHVISGTPTNVHLVVSVYQNGSDFAGVDNFSIASPTACTIYPTTASSALGFASTTSTTTTLNWTNGDGGNRIVVAREGAAVIFTPNDSTTYTADANFSAGQALGSNQHVVYNGNGNSVDLTGLLTNTTYHFAIFEYNCTPGNELYFSTAATANETTVAIPQVAITEFLVNPNNATEADAEWVEIYNYGPTPVDLNGWTLEDEDVDAATIASSSLIIPPGGFKILTANKTFFETDWLGGAANADVIEFSSGSIIYSNSTDEIILKDNTGTVVWSLAYPNDDSEANATFLTYGETLGGTVVWGSKASTGIDRDGVDAASTTLGYEKNNITADIAAYSSATGNVGSPLRNNMTTKTIHVDINASGTNDGAFWVNAYTDFQMALDVANDGDTILVAQGTYVPSKDMMGATTAGRTATFYINNDVEIKGGYPTGGGMPNPMANMTILSGDLGAQGDNTDNSYNVIIMQNATAAMLLDGLVIQDGNANGTVYPANRGGGLSNNGMNSGNSSPTLQNCIFRWNMGTYGGAISNMSNFNGAVNSTITGCLFYENTSAAGSAISNGTYQGGSNSSVITNCTFADNVGTSIHNANGGATITVQNSIIWDFGAPLYNYANEATVQYCLLKSGALPARTIDGGNNMLAMNPEFMDAANDDYGLKAFSVGVDIGSNGLLPGGYTSDLLAGTRIIGATVDLGAIERTISPTLIYVNHAAAGNNDGSSWTDAYTTLQAGLSAASSGTSIWVASGTYLPTAGTDRTASFQVASGVKIYGGFAGGESLLTDRDWAANQTILSGELGSIGTNGDNSYNVVRLHNADTTTTLDGLIIEAGNADGTPYPYNRGGGISNNGMNSGNSSPTIQNCIFRWNQGTYGGAISNMSNFNGAVDATITGCLFYENFSLQGAAIDNGTYQGGSNNSVITNCTFSDNSGVVINNANGGASITIQNSIIWDVTPLANYGNETTLLYSNIYGSSLPTGTTDGGNNQFATDPMFVDPAGTDDYSLQGASPAIAAGSNGLLPAGYTLDLAHTTRQNGATVEMGCYEDAVSSAKTMASNNPTAVDENTSAEEEQAIETTEEELEMSSLEETTTSINMTVYPNPVQDVVNIHLKGIQETVSLQLLNTAGQTMEQEVLEIQEGQTIQLDMSRLANGIYLLNLQLEDGTRLNERVVKF
ncbi:MAG: T9SS type A sorting domain-containing protein [Aureispira sp.]|nr:T9SS type A sorting domain-containing protein [Aureispira sp.]